MKKQKQLTRAVIVLAIVCTVLGFWLVKVYSANKTPTDGLNYSIYIHEDGRAQIDVKSINLVTQEPDGDLVIEGDEQVMW